MGEAVQVDRRDLAVTRQILKVLQENIGGQRDQRRFVLDLLRFKLVVYLKANPAWRLGRLFI